MATASVTKAQADKPIQTQVIDVSAPTRREFLYYIWGASIALILGEATAGIIWFALPRFKAGQFGGVFTYLAKDIPEPNAAPLNIPSGRFWLANPTNDGKTLEGFVALYGVCTHLGCLPKWVDTNHRCGEGHARAEGDRRGRTRQRRRRRRQRNDGKAPIHVRRHVVTGVAGLCGPDRAGADRH